MLFRIEKDELGEMSVPKDAYYGIMTLRSKENFCVAKERIHKQMIKSLAIVKKTAALANKDANLLSLENVKAIAQACDEIINGRYQNQFITDAIQGGAGTSMNMNMNEVIANRANEILGGNLGEYNFVHPIKHINLGQSSVDVVPTAAKLTTIILAKQLLVEIKKLLKSCQDKAKIYANVPKVGRTHLQDSTPISVGQEFGAIASSIERDYYRLETSLQDMYYVNLGVSNTCTGALANPIYLNKVISRLNEYTKMTFSHPKNLLDLTRNMDSFVNVSHAVKLAAINLSKTASDIRLLASGPNAGFNEFTIPLVEINETILKGKVNPVIAEVVNQVCFQIIGKDTTITYAAEHGQLELNVFGPIIYPNLFDSIEYLTRAVKIFKEVIIDKVIVNEEICRHHVESSIGIVSLLIPKLGNDLCEEIALIASKTGKTIKQVVLEKKLLTEKEVDKYLNYDNIASLFHKK